MMATKAEKNSKKKKYLSHGLNVVKTPVTRNSWAQRSFKKKHSALCTFVKQVKFTCVVFKTIVDCIASFDRMYKQTVVYQNSRKSHHMLCYCRTTRRRITKFGTLCGSASTQSLV